MGQHHVSLVAGGAVEYGRHTTFRFLASEAQVWTFWRAAARSVWSWACCACSNLIVDVASQQSCARRAFSARSRGSSRCSSTEEQGRGHWHDEGLAAPPMAENLKLSIWAGDLGACARKSCCGDRKAPGEHTWWACSVPRCKLAGEVASELEGPWRREHVLREAGARVAERNGRCRTCVEARVCKSGGARGGGQVAAVEKRGGRATRLAAGDGDSII